MHRTQARRRAIVETELHQRIFEGGWRILPGYTRRSGRAGE